MAPYTGYIPEGRYLQLSIPVHLKDKALRLAQDVPSAGHQKINRTKNRLRDYWWYHCSADIKSYINSCAACNSMKKSNDPTPRHPLTLYRASNPMEQVHLDFLGPLPKTKSGNECVLMIVDQFTKWVGCNPLPFQTAEVTAAAIVREFFSRFRFPLQVFTNQGRNFASGLL
ncbi:gypsy retrotransposon integrase 1-like protein [Plakobranchus ocellatus]|uniref:Gypsy retrotransposon integrase 1-like protein n=1 Tax=Plakobranchus ocellatus TaxID=259542 RepID=A0AAV3ZGI6_9GAST|nr:gypsy retrotransposon integrase 1-like protein [Plakobranchus ocellatus]